MTCEQLEKIGCFEAFLQFCRIMASNEINHALIGMLTNKAFVRMTASSKVFKSHGVQS